jgi:UDP-glucose 4-epimerase
MRVVLIDAVGSVESDRLAQEVTGRLTSEAFFDTVIRVRWPGGSEDQSRDEAVAALRRSMHLADAVVTLPWTAAMAIDELEEAWPERTRWLCEAVDEAGVQTLIFGSSALGYAAGGGSEPADEAWPMTGLSEKRASRLLAAADTVVGEFERDRPVVRVVRLRPALVFDPVSDAARAARRSSAEEPGLRAQAGEVQVLATPDLTRAIRLALTASVSGPFNLAGPPVRAENLLDAWRPERRRRPWRRASAHRTVDWLMLAATIPLLDTSRAARELGFTAVAPTGRAQAERLSEVVNVPANGATPVSDFRANALYRKAVDYFGDCVREVGDDNWARPAWPGMTIYGLVADAARDQHELTMRLRGCNEAEARSFLPEDPLGVDRVDGWELAVEQARGALDQRAGDLPTAPLGQASPLGELLADSAAGLVARGWCLERALDREAGADAELIGFLEERLSAGQSPAGVPAGVLLDRAQPAASRPR